MPTPPVSQADLDAAVAAYLTHGTYKAAGAAMGVNARTLQSRVDMARARARQGVAPGHFENGVAPGFLMGKVTVQRGSKGNVERTWERQSPDQKLSEDAFRAAIEALVEDVRAGSSPLIVGPEHSNDDLLVVIPMGDPHFGMFSWARETGENFDLKIAERVTIATIDRLVDSAPAAKEALLLNLGDMFHADDGTNRTRQSGAVLDVDGRFPKIATVAIRAMIHCINRMLEKFEVVHVRCNRGNHDPHQSIMLALALEARFHDQPRARINTEPTSFFYHLFGKTLIASTHGDGAKLTDLGAIMANDEPAMWAQSIYRVWHVGHFHHDQLKDQIGCTVETHRTLAAKDSWHTHQGYRSMRDMKAIVYHREFGEVTRIRCPIRMTEGDAQ